MAESWRGRAEQAERELADVRLAYETRGRILEEMQETIDRLLTHSKKVQAVCDAAVAFCARRTHMPLHARREDYEAKRDTLYAAVDALQHPEENTRQGGH